MEQKDTYYNYDVDKLELSLPYIDGNGNVCTVSALYSVDHNILKQNFKENENDNNPVILSYILHITDNTYNTHDIEYKLKFNKYPNTVLFIDDIDNIKIYNNVNAVVNCFSTYCVENNEIKTYKPTIYNFLNKLGKIINPPDSLYTQINNTFSLPEYINGKKVSYTYLLNLNHIKLPFTYTKNNTQQIEYTYKTTLLLGPTSYYFNFEKNTYSFKPHDNIDERFFKEIEVEKTNESLNFSIIPTNYCENKLYSYTLENVSNICNINNLFKFKINNSYIYLSSYFSCENYQLQNNSNTDNSYIIVPAFITQLTKNYLSKKYVIYEYANNSYITQNLQHIQTSNNKIYKYCLQYNNDSDQCIYAYSSASYSLPKLITTNDIYYEYYDTYNVYNKYIYFNTYISNFKIDNTYSINNINLHHKTGLHEFYNNITGYITYSYSYMIDNILNITYQENYDAYTYLLNTQLYIINYNSDNTPVYSIYHNNDETNNDETNNDKINKKLKNLLLDCFKIYVHYDKSIVLKNITNIFNIKYTYLIQESELEEFISSSKKIDFNSLNINDYKFERLYEDEFLNILATKETFNKVFSLTLYDCCIISASLNTNKNIVSDIYIVIYNILGLPNQYKVNINESNTEESNTQKYNIYNIPKNDNNIIYIEYSELLDLLGNKFNSSITFNGISDEYCKNISVTHNIVYKTPGGSLYKLNQGSTEYDEYQKKLYAYFNNELSYMCNVNIKNKYDEEIIYQNGFYNLIYENFYDVKTMNNPKNFTGGQTKLHKYRYTLNGTSFTYHMQQCSNEYTYFTWKNSDNIFLSIKSTHSKNGGEIPQEITNAPPTTTGRTQFYVDEYTFDYTYTDNNEVTYYYTYTCLYKCKENGSDDSMYNYSGNNIVINPVLYEKTSKLTKNYFYKKYIIDDNNVSSTINTFNYKKNMQEHFYRIYLNKLKYNDSIEYILPTEKNILRELYKTNQITKFNQIIDNADNTIIGEFTEDFIKITLSSLNINLNRIYNIKTINNVIYTGNNKMFYDLYSGTSNDKYEILLNKNYKLNTVILLYKYTNGTNEIYFYYINNKFYVVVDNLSNIGSIEVEYYENNSKQTMQFNKIKKTDDIIKGLYQIIPLLTYNNNIKTDSNSDNNYTKTDSNPNKRPIVIIKPSRNANRYFINKPTPLINDNVILVQQDGNIIENWGKITNINYVNLLKKINVVPLLYNEYDNGLSDDDKQLLIDAIESSNSINNNDDFPVINGGVPHQ